MIDVSNKREIADAFYGDRATSEDHVASTCVARNVRKSHASRIAGAMAALVLAVTCVFSFANVAWASTDDNLVSNAGNTIGSSEDETTPISNQIVERDFYWAGKNINLSSIKSGGDILVAGMNLDLSSSKCDGSVRLAGMNLALTNVVAKNNFTLAGQNIELNGCEAEGGVYCAGEKVTFSGTANGGMFAANTVYIDGTINGDAAVYADEVEIGPNAVVMGTLHVESDNEPNVSNSAKIAALDYAVPEKDEGNEAAGAAAGAAIAAAGIFAVIWKALGIVGTIIFAIVLTWLFRRPVERATDMTRSKAGLIFGTGAIAAIAAPVLTIALFCMVITAPIGIALLLALIMLTFASIPFAAASLSRIAFPKMNRFGAAAIGGAVLGLISIIPVLGILVTIACFMHIVGYVIQIIWEYLRKPKNPDNPDNPNGSGQPVCGMPNAPMGYAAAPGATPVAAAPGATPVAAAPGAPASATPAPAAPAFSPTTNGNSTSTNVQP